MIIAPADLPLFYIALSCSAISYCFGYYTHKKCC